MSDLLCKPSFSSIVLTRTWERGVRARFLLAEAEAQRKRWFDTQKSACYARIGEAGRKRLDGQRAECDQEASLQTEKLSCAITSLVQFHDKLSSKLDLGQRYNIGEETEKFITESKAFVNEVRALLVAHVLKDKSDIQSGDTQKHPSGPNVTLIDSLRSQVRDLEERFDQTQTELTLRHQRDIRSEIDELLNAKIAALRTARQREVDRVASQPRAEIVIPPTVLGDIERTAQQVRELDAKVPRTVEDIRVLLLRVDGTTKRVSELEEELSMNKAAYEKVVSDIIRWPEMSLSFFSSRCRRWPRRRRRLNGGWMDDWRRFENNSSSWLHRKVLLPSPLSHRPFAIHEIN